jgi:hypothetical protein
MIDEQGLPERECIHRPKGVSGGFYSGQNYLLSLQRLPSGAAMRMSSKVGSFFWSDAPKVRIWLCQACVSEIRITAS